MSKELLRVEDLKVYYQVKDKKHLFGGKRDVKAVDGVTFSVMEGETFGIVGESGCGKSTLGKTIVNLNRPTAGKLLFDGQELAAKNMEARKANARRIQMIFQDSFSSLDPRFTVGATIEEPMRVHHLGNHAERRQKVLELMDSVGLKAEQYTRYPHEFSGGQRQRIGIARALSLDPALLVCDEPVSALDVSIQAQILNLMQDLQKERNLTYIFISHNLSVVKHICNRIAVMYLGHMVELGTTEQIFSNPKHPYTQALLDSIPVPDPDEASMREILSGDVPSPLNPPKGCVFCTRCRHAGKNCAVAAPKQVEVEAGHFVSCHLIDS